MEPGPVQAWLLVDPSHLPAALKSRSIELCLVPVPPHALERLAVKIPGLDAEFEEVASLVARGIPASEIARRLHISRRTVYRRISRLIAASGSAGRGDLADRLIELGF